MRNYIILNGTNSNTINGLLIQELAPISKPLMRTEIEEIDGRDGDIITPLGFSAYDKQITIGLYGTYDINAIIAFFNSEGTVTFSNEPDKYYNYQIYDQIDFERLVRFKTATVTLHCQPFKFATTGETQTLDSGDPVSDEGTNLVLEGSQLAPFSQFDLKGNTEQDTYTGKNLMKYPYKDTTVTRNGITFTDNGDGTVTANGTASTEALFWITNDIWSYSTNNIVIPAGTYTISKTGRDKVHIYVTVYGKTQGQIGTFNSSTSDATFTTTEEASLTIRLSIKDVGATISNFVFRPQIENGSTSTAYEPYVGAVPAPNPNYPQAVKVVTGENTVKIHGKNLLPITANSSSTGGITMTKNADGSLTFNGTATGNAYFNLNQSASGYVYLESGKTYTLSASTPLPANTRLCCRNTTGTTTNYIDIYGGNQTSKTTTMAVDDSTFTYFAVYGAGTVVNNLTIYPMLELGSTATDFEPYQEQSYPISLGSIELCKIGDYQDYIYKSDGKWYVHKAINKEVLDGSGTWTAGGQGNVYIWRAPASDLVMPSASSVIADIVCSHLKGVTFSDIYYARDTGVAVPSNGQRICVSVITDVATTKAWLDANTPSVYYVLATPTDTEITNEALIEQLDAIANQAHAYKTRTYVDSNAATGNVPHIIAATVVGSADGTITNAGNIYSKPKLTIYGSGDVGVYLNGVQMLQIALGTLGNITIDTDLMEAYTGTIDNLQNRAVTGDYSNFKLAVGANKISFSGSVTSCIVENFSRWL